MPAPMTISGLSKIADRYDGLLCDAWGVIHNGRELFPGVSEALTQFRQSRGPVIILTNAPRLSDVIPAQLDRLGLPRNSYNDIVTSGDATRATVEAHSERPYFRLGPIKDDTLYEAMDVAFTDLENAEAILCTGLNDDLTETPEDYKNLLEEAAAKQLPMICANPDKVVKFGDRLIYCAGALGDLYEELGGEVILCGKPHAPIYDLARKKATKHGLPENGRLLAIGDGFQTDILGANQQQIDVVYVADGIFSEESRGLSGALEPAKVAALLDRYNVTAKFAMDGLNW